ncbi:MAG: hypothetical protein OHK0053_09030 [Microscillaceae bacterium]
MLACQPQSGSNVPGFDQEAQKAKLVAQVSELSCQDAHDFITKWGGKLLPLVGDFVVEKIIKPNGEGDLCNCLKPQLEAELKSQKELNELEAMITDRPARRKFLKSVLISQRQSILACFKTNGLDKGLKFLEKLLNKVANSPEEVS